MARCGCGGSCGCNLEAGTNVTVGGTGAPADPWIISSLTHCTQVRNCITEGTGIDYNSGTGVVSVCVSPDVGNNIGLDANGSLFVPTGAATVMSGCGLTGDGSGSDPVRANVAVWPYPCAVGSRGSVISCD